MKRKSKKIKREVYKYVQKDVDEFNELMQRFTTHRDVVYRENGRPVALCRNCGLPTCVTSVKGITRYHKCNSYSMNGGDKTITWVGCGDKFSTEGWKLP